MLPTFIWLDQQGIYMEKKVNAFGLRCEMTSFYLKIF